MKRQFIYNTVTEIAFNVLCIAIFCCISLYSCKDPKPSCKDAVTNTINISNEMRHVIPYYDNPLFDTIVFANQIGDTLIFGQYPKDSFYNCEPINGDPDCLWDKNCFQLINYTYASIKGNSIFAVTHWKQTHEGISDFVQIRLGELFFEITDRYIGGKINTIYFDSVIFAGRTFYSTVLLYHERTNQSVGKAYINKEFGLFRIDDVKNNLQWNLVNK